jgi:hypothetical protein
MENEKYIADLKEIRSIMSKSTQFISLSGLSGIIIGVYALIGASVAFYIIEQHDRNYITLESLTFKKLIFTAVCVLVVSLLTGIFFTYKKAKKKSLSVLSKPAIQLIFNFSIPLLTGGIFSILLLRHGYYGLIGATTLIFYGLACVNASKYTYRDIRHLGIIQVVLGLISVEFPGNSLYFWAIGFGVCHIIYGALMYYKYDLKK